MFITVFYVSLMLSIVIGALQIFLMTTKIVIVMVLI